MTVPAMLDVREVPLDELHENPGNPRTIKDERLRSLARSLEAEPSMLWARPVVALPDGTIVAGNMRWRAAALAGRESVPAVTVDLDPDRARLWMLRDNQEYGEWEVDMLAEIVAELAKNDADLELTGFDDDELQTLLRAQAELDDDEDGGEATQGEKLAAMKVTVGPPKHETARGEVWQVGRHHLVCTSVYSGWSLYVPLLGEDDLLVPYPTPVVALTERAEERRLVMVQPDGWLAGHLLDKYAEVFGAKTVKKLT